MAGLGPSSSGSALTGRRTQNNVRIAASSVSSLRVRPFLAPKLSGRPQIQKVRSAEPDAEPAAAVVEAVAAPRESREEDDFEFSYSGAKKNNEYTAKDVEAAMKLYFEGEGIESDYELDHVSNLTGMEDASFFDDIDNVDGYEEDEYATAGISEAAPKRKQQERKGPAEGNDEGDEIDKVRDLQCLWHPMPNLRLFWV